MSLVETNVKQEEETKYIYCQSCLKCMPLTSESNIINYNFHTDTYTGFCLNVSSCEKKYYLG